MGRGSAIGIVVVVAIAALPAPALAQGCAMCRRALQSPEGQQMVSAFQSGILVLLVAPFSLVGIVATLVVRMQRRRSMDAAAAPPSTADPA